MQRPINKPFLPNFFAPINEPMRVEKPRITTLIGVIKEKGISIFVRTNERINSKTPDNKIEIMLPVSIGLI